MALGRWEQELVDQLMPAPSLCLFCGRRPELVCVGSDRTDGAFESICALHLPRAADRWREYEVKALRLGGAWALAPWDLLGVAGAIGPYRVMPLDAMHQHARDLLRQRAIEAGVRVPRLRPRPWQKPTTTIDATTPMPMVRLAVLELSSPGARNRSLATPTRAPHGTQGSPRLLTWVVLVLAMTVAARVFQVALG